MVEFLHQLAREIENNQALARRLAEPFKGLWEEAATKPKKSGGKQKKYPTPEGFDPCQVFYDEGSPGLYNRLHSLSVDELKGVLAQYTKIPRDSFVRKKKADDLIELIIIGVKNIATRGQAFGDYELKE